MKNVNHRNTYIAEPKLVEKELVVEKVKPIKKEPKLKTSVDELYDLTKAEQVNMLMELGISKLDIKKLKKEKARVDKLFGLIN